MDGIEALMRHIYLFPLVGAALGLALLILLASSWLTRFLSRERIVTTLPE